MPQWNSEQTGFPHWARVTLPCRTASPWAGGTFLHHSIQLKGTNNPQLKHHPLQTFLSQRLAAFFLHYTIHQGLLEKKHSPCVHTGNPGTSSIPGGASVHSCLATLTGTWKVPWNECEPPTSDQGHCFCSEKLFPYFLFTEEVNPKKQQPFSR